MPKAAIQISFNVNGNLQNGPSITFCLEDFAQIVA